MFQPAHHEEAKKKKKKRKKKKKAGLKPKSGHEERQGTTAATTLPTVTSPSKDRNDGRGGGSRIEKGNKLILPNIVQPTFDGVVAVQPTPGVTWEAHVEVKSNLARQKIEGAALRFQIKIIQAKEKRQVSL